MLPQLSEFVVKLASLIPTFLVIIRAFCFLMAIILTGHALYRWYQLSQPMSQNQVQNNTVLGPIIEILIAGFLLALSKDIVVQKVIASWLSTKTFQMPSSLSYQPQSSISGIKILIGLALENIMFLLGTLAIIKGLFVLKNSGYGAQQSSVFSGVSYLVFAAFALNFKSTVGLVDVGFGFQLGKFLF